MRLRLLSGDDVRRALPMADAIKAMRGAFRALHAGQVTMPVRLGVPTPHGVTLFMPAYVASSATMGQKVVSVFGRNSERALPTIHALVSLYDGETGEPRAIMEGTYLTALRTAAVTGLAVDVLARPDARRLTIFGAGGQAPAQIEAVCAARHIEEITIISRGQSAGALAARLQNDDPTRRYLASSDAEAAVRGADIVVAATSSTTPVFDGQWLQPGTLVCAVGSFRPDMQEVDVTTLRRAAVIVDQREAALEEAGDLLVPMASGDWSIEQLYCELGALVSGDVASPASAESIVYFKSCGLAVEDVAAARAVLEVADREGLGQIVEL